jgi:predicted nucleotidyltransferase
MDQRFDVYRGAECVQRAASLRQAAELLKIEMIDLAVTTLNYGRCMVGEFSAFPSEDAQDRINIFQQRVLQNIAEFADRFECIHALYLFGSVARGDTASANDIDICVHFVEGIENSTFLIKSYEQFQEQFEEWAEQHRCLIDRKVSVHNPFIREPKDKAWDVIQQHLPHASKRIRKAIMVPTPPTLER